MKRKPDAQQVEFIGTKLLEAELVRERFEVAHPIRDRGIDLLVYRDDRGKPFVALPIQVKASSSERFDLDRKYERTTNLVLAFVWNIPRSNNSRPRYFLLTYAEALSLLGSARKTKSWQKGRRYAFTRQVPRQLERQLRQNYEDRWKWLREKLSREK